MAIRTTHREIINMGQITVSYLLQGKDTNNSMEMFEFCIQPGAKVPVPHYHKDYDEIVYGIEGVITFTLEGVIHQIPPGESLFIPRGAVHGFINNGQIPTRTLAVLTPGILGPGYFRDCSALVNAGSQPDLEKLTAIMLRYGLVPALPGV